MLKLFILAIAAISCAHECPVPIVCPVETVPMCEEPAKIDSKAKPAPSVPANYAPDSEMIVPADTAKTPSPMKAHKPKKKAKAK